MAERLRALVGRGYRGVRERGGKVVERGLGAARRSGERVGPTVAGVKGKLWKRVGRYPHPSPPPHAGEGAASDEAD